MKIRKCPHCAQFNHFEPQSALRRCWNCALISDFSLISTPEEHVALWFGSRPMPNIARFVGVGRVALVIAVPIAVVMLLVCNSFDIRIVRDVASPFVMP